MIFATFHFFCYIQVFANPEDYAHVKPNTTTTPDPHIERIRRYALYFRLKGFLQNVWGKVARIAKLKKIKQNNNINKI